MYICHELIYLNVYNFVGCSYTIEPIEKQRTCASSSSLQLSLRHPISSAVRLNVINKMLLVFYIVTALLILKLLINRWSKYS